MAMPLSEFRDDLVETELIAIRLEHAGRIDELDNELVETRIRDGARERDLAADDVARIFERLAEAGREDE